MNFIHLHSISIFRRGKRRQSLSPCRNPKGCERFHGPNAAGIALIGEIGPSRLQLVLRIHTAGLFVVSRLESCNYDKGTNGALNLILIS